MEQNKQEKQIEQSYILSQDNLDNFAKYVSTLPWATADPIMKFIRTAYFAVEKADADKLIEETNKKNAVAKEQAAKTEPVKATVVESTNNMQQNY